MVENIGKLIQIKLNACLNVRWGAIYIPGTDNTSAVGFNLTLPLERFKT